MARRGENIYKRKDNRWEGRYIKDSSGGKTQYGYVYAKTYREVREKLNAAKLGILQPASPKHKTMATYCEEWLVLSRNRVKESTYVKYYTIINHHILPAFERTPPQKISTVTVEQFSHTLLQNALSPKTVRDILAVLRAVLTYCRKQIGAGFPEIDIIYPKERKKEMRVLSMEEQKQLISLLLADIDEIKFGILLALLTGMRIGEVCALKWGNISLKEGVIRIANTMQRLQDLNSTGDAKTKILVDEAKSDSSKRIVPLTAQAVALCENMQVADPEAYILTGKREHFLEPRALQYRLKKYTAACGLSDVHFHVLRHTFATRCVEVGFEIKSLSEILGHSSTKITLDRYVHSSLELKRANMEKLAAIGL